MIAKKIIKNTICSLLGQNWQLLLTFITVPYIIKHIGVEKFGLWAILNVFTTYFGLFDFGIGSGFVKYIAQFHSKKDFHNINRVISTGAFVYLIFAIIIMFIPFIATSWIIMFFKIPNEILGEAVFVIRISILIYCMSVTLSVFRSVIDGLQRMEISNSIGVIGSILRFAGIIVVLNLNYGLKGLILNNLVVFLFTTALLIFFSCRLLPQIKIGIRYVSLTTFKILFNFGIKLQISKLSSFSNFELDKFILAHFLGLGSVVYYQLGSKVAEIMRRMLYPLFTSVTPAASQLNACDEHEKIYILFSRASKYIVLASVPMVCLILFNAKLIMKCWMGSGFEASAIVMQVLIFGYFANISCGVISPIVQGIGKPQIQMRAAVLSTIMNVFLSIILVVKFGFYGAAIGTTISMILANLYYVYIFHKITNRSLANYFFSTHIRPLLAGILALFIVVVIRRFYDLPEDLSRLQSFIALAVFSLAFILLYLVIIKYMSCLDDYDKNIIRSCIPLYKNGTGLAPNK